MKRLFNLFLIFAMAITLMSCGNRETINAPNSAGYLPTRLEMINEGGKVPEGSEADKDMNVGNYPMESVWGTWVPASETMSEKTFTTNTSTYTNEETGEESEPKSIKLNVFPRELNFSPAWVDASPWSAGISSFRYQSNYFSWDMNQEEEDYDNTVLGAALRNQGLGQGYVKYDYIEPEDDFAALELVASGGIYRIAYGISEDTLAIGLISTSDSEPTSFDIEEIDYNITFSGWKLTLSYGDESVTYIPRGFQQAEIIDLNRKGVEPGYENVNGILGIYNLNSTQQIMYDFHEGYNDVKINFGEDGTMVIDDLNGNRSELQYLVSSDTLTLISDSELGVYSSYRNSNESLNISAGTKVGIMTSMENSGASIKVEDEIISFSAMSDFQKLIDAGFTTSVDLNQAMNSCVVSDEIILQKSGSSMKVKVVNPWDSPTALRECKICYVYVDDTTGTISPGDESVIGTTEYESVERYFEAAYEKTPDLLRYKSCSTADLMKFLLDVENETHGERLLDINDTEMELFYHFKNGVLCAYELQCPVLLYNGLQDNVSDEALANMDAATMTGVIETRDDILTQLKNAFVNSGISIQIDGSTGEIIMDSTILFGFDSTELTEEGRHYIDSFMGVYASVILDNSLKDIISEVRFEGHTDSSGGYDYNLDLSQKRADTVLNYCLNSNAVSMNQDQRQRLSSIASTIGYSYADLVYDADGNEDEEASRRVAVKFYINVD